MFCTGESQFLLDPSRPRSRSQTEADSVAWMRTYSRHRQFTPVLPYTLLLWCSTGKPPVMKGWDHPGSKLRLHWMIIPRTSSRPSTSIRLSQLGSVKDSTLASERQQDALHHPRPPRQIAPHHFIRPTSMKIWPTAAVLIKLASTDYYTVLATTQYWLSHRTSTGYGRQAPSALSQIYIRGGIKFQEPPLLSVASYP